MWSEYKMTFEDEIKDLTSQFEGVFNEIQEGMENMDYPEEGTPSGGIPLGSIFSNIFNGNNSTSSEKQNGDSASFITCEY